MYNYLWDIKTGGYTLTTQSVKFVANELRPVFAEELQLIGFDKHFAFDACERRPLMWAQQNVYIYRGNIVAKLNKTQLGKPLDREFLSGPCVLKPVDVEAMIAKNQIIMDALITDTLRRIKEMYELYNVNCDVTYIGFSGGKDSVLLLDLCHRVLPLSVPVIFSDTDMELPDTYEVWEEVQKKYSERTFIKVKAELPALDNWYLFGPPSRSVRWCCSVHKSAPALVELKRRLHQTFIKAFAFIGVRSEESISRSSYEDIGEGVKNASQVNGMPILNLGAHELYLYLFANGLPINRAYRYGLPRVGCIMCPEAPDKYAWFVDAIYPTLIEPYKKAIIETNSKSFISSEDEDLFIASSGWQARKSGVTLKLFFSRPAEKISADKIEWNLPEIPEKPFFEWIKTLGFIETTEDPHCFQLLCRGKLSSVGIVAVKLGVCNHKITFISCKLQSSKLIRQFQFPMRKVIYKSLACVSCQSCAAECPTGALNNRSNVVNVDGQKCIQCLQCHSADDGCWRFMSMEVSNDSNSTLSGIDRYKHFGFKREWIDMYIEEKEKLFSSGRLGINMIPSARNWFLHSLLSAGKCDTPSKLLLVAHKFGTDSIVFWDLIWVGLAHYSALIKWFVCTCSFGQPYTIDELFHLLGDVKESTKGGGIDSLKATFRMSPLGISVVHTEKKGDRITAISRIKHQIEPLVLLYALYIMSRIADKRSTFTISEMLSGHFESAIVSPLVAFGMPVDELKAQCAGLAEKYPSYISCSFNLGLDEVRIYPHDKSSDDVLGLIIG